MAKDLFKGCGLHEHHSHSLYDEIITHFPYAILSIAIGMILLSFLSFFSYIPGNELILRSSGHMMFHCFHFVHIIFAATGSLITFFRFSKNIYWGIFISAISSIFFCVLSDILMPYVAGELLGVHMHFHVCFISELRNVVPFLVIGLVNGFFMSRHCTSKQTIYSLGSHFAHILISSLASLFYIVSNGLDHWYVVMGPLFVLLILAVLVPCTLSDLVVPLWCARVGGKKVR